MPERCATRPFLRLVGYDREWKGVSPSSAGNGPRAIYLKATTDYIIDPNDRVWAAFGTSTNEKLSIHAYTHNVLSEEKLSDAEMTGIADCLEEDENRPGYFVITDYKSWGSFKVAKAYGIGSETVEDPVLDSENKPVLLKSGPNKGKAKTTKRQVITQDPTRIDLRGEELQINAYRLLFEKYGFPVSQMRIQVVSRDGGTYIAKGRGVDRNLYVIPIKRLVDKDVINFYRHLSDEVNIAFASGYARMCDYWESWGKRRCKGFCEVSEVCKTMNSTII